MPTQWSEWRWSRRGLLGQALALSGAGLLGGCDRLSRSEGVRSVLASAESATLGVQRSVIGREALAREFGEADISALFPANGTTNPQDTDYRVLAAAGFADWRLQVDGLVEQPLQLSLAELRALPARTQITRHDCVEGWSSIGKWTGARLAALLERVRLKPEARYLVFHCADTMERTLSGVVKYYESIDLVDAFHEQTILAYEMNGQPLDVGHGAPLRLRVERQLGYKHAKYVMRIEAVHSFETIGDGKGGYWEDRGYEWYAGI